MNFDLRSLTLGLVIGLLVGVYISPAIDAPKFNRTELDAGQLQNPELSIDKPTNEQALVAIFAAQEWNLTTRGQGASARVDDCAQTLTALVCDVALVLPWAKIEIKPKVSFGKIDGKWVARRLKTAE